MRFSLFSFLIFLCGCGSEKKAPPPVPPVRVAEAGTAEVAESFEMIASVRPERLVRLVPRVSGFLEKKGFRDGSFVKAGTVLYEIEREPYEAAVRRCEANLLRAKAEALDATLEYARAEALFQEKIASPKRYDNARAGKAAAEASVLAAEAELVNANLNLSYTRISAPFDGWIGIGRVDPGNYLAAPGPVLAEIAAVDRVFVDFQVSDSRLTGLLLRNLAEGNLSGWRVRVRFRDGTLLAETGKIAQWENLIDRTTGTLAMRAEFPNPERILLPGLYVTAVMESPVPRRVTVVDPEAVRRVQGRAFVFVVNPDSVLEYRAIETETENADGKTVVLSGLNPGEKTVLAGNPFLRPGMRVRIVSGSPEPERMK